jgi:uroporphyrinogen decarboxylase
MTHRERVALSLSHAEPDRPPRGEILIDPDFLNVAEPDITDRHTATLRVVERFDLDVISEDLLRPAPRQVGVAERGLPIFEDCWGVRYEYAQDGLHYRDFLVPTPDAAAAFAFPAPAIYSAENLARYKAASDRSIWAIVGGVFDNLVPLMGFDQLMLWSLEAPEALRLLAEKAAVFNAALADISARVGADVIIVADDFAYNNGTFLSPAAMRTIFFPCFAQLVADIRRRTGKPCFLHCDGNLNAVMDDIVACGFTGLQSLQPSAGMDIRAIKRRYGRRLCLMGNIDLNYLLPYGTPDEIAAHVRDLARDLAPGGGWILSTCNTLSRAVPVANAAAMYAAVTPR